MVWKCGTVYPICSKMLAYFPTFARKIAQFCRWIYQHHGSHLGIEKCWGYSLLSRPQIWSTGYPTGSHDGFFTLSLEAKTLRVCWPILTAFNWLGCHPIGDPICEPWCWNIYLHLPNKWPSFVGKYTSTMEHMGMFIRRFPESTMTSGNHRKKHVPQNQSKLECKSTNMGLSENMVYSQL